MLASPICNLLSRQRTFRGFVDEGAVWASFLKRRGGIAFNFIQMNIGGLGVDAMKLCEAREAWE